MMYQGNSSAKMDYGAALRLVQRGSVDKIVHQSSTAHRIAHSLISSHPVRHGFGSGFQPVSLNAKIQWPAPGKQFNRDTTWLADALQELSELDEEIADEGYPEINSTTKAAAKRILGKLESRRAPPTVYPTQDGQIAIHFKAPAASKAVLILLGDDERADCYSYTDGRSRRAHYDSNSELPDEFVNAQLRKLNELAIQDS